MQVFENGTDAGAATRYSYDPHGNVKTLWQRLPELSETKKIEYNYDLISGKVNELVYQKGKDDEFRHRYRYDADNRILSAQTSREGYIWNEEARYFYYAHGPLARTELGEYKVQGLDYFYTLQGWIKGVNNTNDGNDFGGEGTADKQLYTSQDVFAYRLDYFSGDYEGIESTVSTGLLATHSFTNLYNGNIGSMATKLSMFSTLTRNFEYDQLNRLMQVRKQFNGRPRYPMMYAEDFAYLPNSNFKSAKKYDETGTLIDDLRYSYQSNTNKMTQTEDLVGLVRPDIGDLPTQGANNYEYDAIGRKMKDISENITSIDWTPTDKIRKVVQGETTYEHRYDAMGWRIKTTRTDTEGTHTTHYVRDASGNVMGTYENTEAKELSIYGSSRIGSYISFSQKYTQTLGFGRYELTNHLGSVLSVVSDNKHKTGTTYTARIISQTDYYAYGWQLSGRTYSESPQRHGYQGSEKSPYTNGNYTTFYRELDTRNPHWWSIDPKFNPSESPYVSMGANPIWFNDVLGDCPDCPKGEEADKTYVKGAEVTNKYGSWRYEGGGNWTDLNKVVSEAKETEKLEKKEELSKRMKRGGTALGFNFSFALVKGVTVGFGVVQDADETGFYASYSFIEGLAIDADFSTTVIVPEPGKTFDISNNFAGTGDQFGLGYGPLGFAIGGDKDVKGHGRFQEPRNYTSYTITLGAGFSFTDYLVGRRKTKPSKEQNYFSDDMLEFGDLKNGTKLSKSQKIYKIISDFSFTNSVGNHNETVVIKPKWLQYLNIN